MEQPLYTRNVVVLVLFVTVTRGQPSSTPVGVSSVTVGVPDLTWEVTSALTETTNATVESLSATVVPSGTPVEPSTAPGSVRLVNGTGRHEGRVEIFYNDTWGTVCDNFWSKDDGLVVCRQLGYPGVQETYKQAHFGEGTGPVLFDNLRCEGNEGNLTQCPRGVVNCNHSEDAGVACETESVSLSSATKKPTASTPALPSATTVLTLPHPTVGAISSSSVQYSSSFITPAPTLVVKPAAATGNLGWVAAVIVVVLLLICIIVASVVLCCVVYFVWARRTREYDVPAAEKTSKVNYVYEMEEQESLQPKEEVHEHSPNLVTAT